jgi:Tol biopolymer transport system component
VDRLRVWRAWAALATIVGLVAWGIVAYAIGDGRHWDVGDPAWSPDGTRVVFHSSRRGGRPQIYAVNPNGIGFVRLTDSKTYDREPDWSPDGQMIVFVSSTNDPDESRFGDEASDAELYLISAHGGRRKRLTHNRIAEAEPTWSPDGKWIAVEEESNYPLTELYLISSDGKRLRHLKAHTYDPDEAVVGSPAWSPDGSRLLVSVEFAGLYVIDLKRKRAVQITHPVNGEIDESPAWSPVGHRIAFERDRIVVHGSGTFFHVLVINADGTNARLLTENGYDPDWAPDGSKVVFGRPGDRQSLFVINADGTELHRLIDG